MEHLWIAFVAGAVALYVYATTWGSEAARLRRSLKRLPQRPIAELSDGEMARVVGKVVLAEKKLAAPLTGRPCAAYESWVEEPTKYYRSPGFWAQRAFEHKSVDFYIEDESGRVEVRSEGAEFALVRSYRSTSTGVSPSEGLEQAYLRAHDIIEKELVLYKHLRFNEAALVEGEQACVMGRVTQSATDSDGAAGPLSFTRSQVPLLIREQR